MTTLEFEYVLARLYSNKEDLDAFIKDPSSFLNTTTLSLEEREYFLKADVVGLQMANQSFSFKRNKKSKHQKIKPNLFKRVFGQFY